MRNYVDRLAAEGRPSVQSEGGGKISISLPDVQQFGVPGMAAVAPSGSASRLLAAKDPDAFFDWLMASVPAHVEGLSMAEHGRREHELEHAICAAECIEEALIMRAEQEGLHVLRRIDASPFAVLGLLAPALDPLLLAAA